MDNKSLIVIILILLVGSGTAYWYKTHKLGNANPQQQQEWENWNQQQTPPVQPQPQTAPPNQPQQALPKPNTYAEALAQSKQTSKPMLLYFGAEWCPHCVKMAPIFETPQVKAELDKFIFYKVNVDNERDVARKYKVGPIPAYLIADSSEKTLKKDEGEKSSAQFVKWLNGSDAGFFIFKRRIPDFSHGYQATRI